MHVSKLARMAALALLPVVLPAADVSGKWIARIPSREGGSRTVYFVFEVKGTALSGKMIDAHGDNPISDGRVDGDRVSFTIEYKLGSDTVKRYYSGTVTADGIEFTSQGNAGENQKKFSAKRL